MTVVVVGSPVYGAVVPQIAHPVQSHWLERPSHVAKPSGIWAAISSHVRGSSGGPQVAGQSPVVVLPVKPALVVVVGPAVVVSPVVVVVGSPV